MSLDLQSQMALMVSPIVKFLAVRLAVAVPVNPSEIVSIEGEEFRINMNSMKTLQPYLIEFFDSRYVIWKNQDSALVMTEV